MLKWKLTTTRFLAIPAFDNPFIVEMDESSVVIRDIVAQQGNYEKNHPIQFASWTMPSAERSYLACEREALTVIFALKKFPVDLL